MDNAESFDLLSVRSGLNSLRTNLDLCESRGQLPDLLSDLATSMYQTSSLFENSELFTGLGAINAPDPLTVFEVRDILALYADLYDKWCLVLRKG